MTSVDPYGAPSSSTRRARSTSVRGRNPVASETAVSGRHEPHMSACGSSLWSSPIACPSSWSDDVTSDHGVASIGTAHRTDDHEVAGRVDPRQRPRKRHDVLAGQEHDDVRVEPRQCFRRGRFEIAGWQPAGTRCDPARVVLERARDGRLDDDLRLGQPGLDPDAREYLIPESDGLMRRVEPGVGRGRREQEDGNAPPPRPGRATRPGGPAAARSR